MRPQYGSQVRPLRPVPGLPRLPECKFTKPLVVEMPGRCPVRRPAHEAHRHQQKSGKQHNYYCCEKFPTCSFVTFDVPVKDDCPVCGHTMFKKKIRPGFKRPFCINPACENFLPEDQRGYPKRTAASDGTESGTNGTAADGQPTSETVQTEVSDKPAAKKTATAKKNCGKEKHR